MNETLNLYRLQELDTQIDQARKRIAEIEDTLNSDRRIKKAQHRVAEAESKSKEHRIALHQIEDKVEAQRIKLKLTQKSLFSGNIKNPKELQDLQMESEALTRFIATLEDQQLEKMIQSEDSEKSLRQARQKLLDIKALVTEENAALLGEKLQLEDDLPRLMTEKKAVLGSISKDMLQKYRKLRKAKGGHAVTKVTDGGCSLCGHQLTPSDLQAVRSASITHYCPSCGRFLFGG
jgi:hypothetical protein